jgi:hypothetical protein
MTEPEFLALREAILNVIKRAFPFWTGAYFSFDGILVAGVDRPSLVVQQWYDAVRFSQCTLPSQVEVVCTVPIVGDWRDHPEALARGLWDSLQEVYGGRTLTSATSLAWFASEFRKEFFGADVPADNRYARLRS